MDKDENKKTNQKILLSFIIGIMVGGGLVWFMIGSEVLSPTIMINDEGDTTVMDTIDTAGNQNSAGDTTGKVVSTANNYIIVDDQLAGERVLLQEVAVSDASWVVVHEEVGGVLGNALGAARFDPGVYTEGYVDLLRNTEIGETYHVFMYRDNGDKEFTLTEDRIVVDAEGNAVGTTFKAFRIDRKTN